MFDIKNEGLGFVQWYGELVLVPFVYSLPALYTAYHGDNITNVRAAGAIALFGKFGQNIPTWAIIRCSVFSCSMWCSICFSVC